MIRRRKPGQRRLVTTLPEFTSEPSEMGQQLRELTETLGGVDQIKLLLSARFDGAVIRDIPAARSWHWEEMLNDPVMMDDRELAVTTTRTQGHEWSIGTVVVLIDNNVRQVQAVEERNRGVLSAEALDNLWVVRSLRHCRYQLLSGVVQDAIAFRLERTSVNELEWDDREYTWFDVDRQDRLESGRLQVLLSQSVEVLPFWQNGNKVEIRLEMVGGHYRCGVRRWKESDQDKDGFKGVIDSMSTQIRGESQDALVEMSVVYADTKPQPKKFSFLGLPADTSPFRPRLPSMFDGPVSSQINADIARAWEELEFNPGVEVGRSEDGQITNLTINNAGSGSTDATDLLENIDIVVDPAMPPGQAALVDKAALAQMGVPRELANMDPPATAAGIAATAADILAADRRRRDFQFELRKIRFQCETKVPSETFQPFDPSVTPVKTGRLLAKSGNLKRFQTMVGQPYRWTLEQLSKRNLEAAWESLRSTHTSPTAVIGTVFASIISSGRRR